MEMGISPTGVAQKAKKAYINHSRSQSPDPDALAKYFMCLDGAGEAWFGLMEEDTLFNMQDWEAREAREAMEGRRSNKRRRIR
jgi:hypothetical protein